MEGKRVCLACRTMFDEGESCEGKKHETVSLANAFERTKMDNEVWGPDSRARAFRKAAKVGAGGGAVGGLSQGCGGCDGLSGCGSGDLAGAGEGLFAILAIIVVVIVFAGVALLVWGIARAIYNWYQNRPKPQGALYQPPRPRTRGVRARGRVTSGNEIAMPWTNAVSMAWAYELFQKRVFGGGAMLREARTGGFDVSLDDGRILRIPAGRIRIASRLAATEADDEHLEKYLADADPKRFEKETLFPHDTIRAATIREGSRIEIVSDIEPKPDATAGHAYREGGKIFGPVAVPVLRIVEGGDDAGPRVRIANDDRALAEAAEAESEAESMREPRAGKRMR